jgi:hypothetical protein
MLILEEFESSTNRLTTLLAAMTTLNEQGGAPAITLEWMQHASELLSRTSALMSNERFAELKSSPQVNRYRQELQRLKETVESGRHQLSVQRSVIQTEQARLRQVCALTGTLQSLK